MSELLDKFTGKKKQQLISESQKGERCREYTHAQLFAHGYLCGQRALEWGVDYRTLRH